VFALPNAGVVIRITRSHVFEDRVRKVARLARWFCQVGAPTVRLVPSIPQPIPAQGLLATAWRYLPPTPPAPTVQNLGHVLRRFHANDPPPFPLPSWDPIGDVRCRLTDAEALLDGDRAFLEDWCDRLAPRVAQGRPHGEVSCLCRFLFQRPPSEPGVPVSEYRALQ
jgi:hypothetical protein